MDMKIAVNGFGNVGRALAELLRDHAESYQRRYGIRLVISGVADRGGAVVDPQGLDLGGLLDAKREAGSVEALPGGQHVGPGEPFLRASTADVLVEAASTNFEDAEPGWSTIRAALACNMDLVLASKGALVLHYRQLMQEAEAKGRSVRYSATVGAPLPILDLIERTLVGTNVVGFEGLLNGTSNEILAAMSNGKTYDEGVAAAQELGIAETDPTLDVDGWDAAAKAVIVANTLFGADLDLNDVGRKGIRSVQPQELHEAASRGETVKLVSRVRRHGETAVAEVLPEPRSLVDPLGRLRGSEMGVVFHVEPLGHVTSTVEHTGGVAGGIPTALTVLRDVIHLGRDQRRARSGA